MQNQRSKRVIIGASLLFATPLVSCGDDDAFEDNATLEVGQSCTPPEMGSGADTEDNFSCDESGDQVLVCDRRTNSWKPYYNDGGIVCTCAEHTLSCTYAVSAGYSGITSSNRPQPKRLLRYTARS